MELFGLLNKLFKDENSPYNIRGYRLWGILFDPHYLTHMSLYDCIKKESELFVSGELLDFGCGSKPYESLFGKVDKYIGVDIEKSGHNHSNEKIDYFWDGKTLPFNDEKFDYLLSTEVIEHVFDVDDVMLELNRVLKKGGLALFTVPFSWELHEKPYDYGRYTEYGIAYLLRKHGFEIMSIDKTGNYLRTLYQLKNEYWAKIFAKRGDKCSYNVYRLFVALPITVRGLFWSKVLPSSRDLYFDNVVLARKVKDNNELFN